ncbi:Pectin lyase-like superfamily protein [Quillaja saponaria]|uniref:endo-polygalacturonase n=1 Tax=Quillaja saponaria TaxID=32244 RepID=A0AAD7PE87_QUISA|nr:Pectin lyase-like superfamily protein [Quillaja saponaria]
MENLRSYPYSIISIALIHVIILGSLKFAFTEGFDSVIQLPSSGSTRTRPRSKRVFYIDDFGAKGNGLNDDSKAFKDAWKSACSLSGRAKVVIPSGKSFLLHPIDIAGPCQSKVTLRILGTIIAPKDPDAWAGLNPRKWLYFHGVKYLTIEGGGTINGMGQEWWARSCKTNSTNRCRKAPTAITFHRCKNLKVRKLKVVDSQKMHIAFTSCMHVVASQLQVLAPATSPNTDGIHISATKGIEVKDSIIRTGDDCVSIVSNSSHIRIRNISCGPGHGISIGSLGKSNSRSQVRDVMVDGAYLDNTDNGVRIKTWQGGRGFAAKITFQNVFMENVSNPIIIDQYYCDSKHPCKNQTSAVKVEDISFIHIRGTSATEEAVKFACSDTSPCEDLYLEDIFLISNDGGRTRSSCWKAHGSCSSLVHPPPCLRDCESFTRQTVGLDSAIHSS